LGEEYGAFAGGKNKVVYVVLQVNNNGGEASAIKIMARKKKATLHVQSAQISQPPMAAE
jgi:hypothetical protein